MLPRIRFRPTLCMSEAAAWAEPGWGAWLCTTTTSSTVPNPQQAVDHNWPALPPAFRTCACWRMHPATPPLRPWTAIVAPLAWPPCRVCPRAPASRQHPVRRRRCGAGGPLHTWEGWLHRLQCVPEGHPRSNKHQLQHRLVVAWLQARGGGAPVAHRLVHTSVRR